MVNPAQSVNRGGGDSTVVKLNATGSALLYSTYYGGTQTDLASAVIVDSAGRASATGVTVAPDGSNDLPLVAPIQTTFVGGGELSDAFVFTLSADGSTLSFSTYLGGRWIDGGNGIDVDSAGHLYVGGYTYSLGFPMEPPLRPAYPGLGTGGWVAKIVPGSNGITAASPMSGEPGGQITASATGAQPGATYVLAMGTSEVGCRNGTRLGGSVVAGANGSIAPTVRTIPTNATSGTRYLCWVSDEDSSVGTLSVAVAVFWRPSHAWRLR